MLQYGAHTDYYMVTQNELRVVNHDMVHMVARPHTVEDLPNREEKDAREAPTTGKVVEQADLHEIPSPACESFA